MSRLHNIIVNPLDTEKAYGQQAEGKYVLHVLPDATKTEVKDAVEKYYGVKVKSIRTLRNHDKIRSSGRRPTIKRPTFKKAIVTTEGAAPIDFNKIKA